jgi:DNA processing protein
MSKGCNQLIARGQATALTSAGQLVSELGWDQLPLEQAIRKEPVLMSEDEKLLWKLLEEHGRLSRDSITIELGWDNSRLAVNLLEMEMRGLVKPLPGDRYERA